MIVRILTEGQLEVPDSAIDELNDLDTKVLETCQAKDEAAFRTALDTLLARVREIGTPIPLDRLVESDFVLPMADSTLDEVEAMMSEEGLIPG
jgi:PspA-Associated protein